MTIAKELRELVRLSGRTARAATDRGAQPNPVGAAPGQPVQGRAGGLRTLGAI